MRENANRVEALTIAQEHLSGAEFQESIVSKHGSLTYWLAQSLSELFLQNMGSHAIIENSHNFLFQEILSTLESRQQLRPLQKL